MKWKNIFYYVICIGFLAIGLIAENQFSVLRHVKSIFVFEKSNDHDLYGKNLIVNELRFYISEENYEQIITQQKKALNGEKEFTYVNAFCIIENDSLPIKVKLKGDRAIHFNDSSKLSFRVKVLNGKSVFKLKKFSLHHPIARNYVYEWIFHRALDKLGLLSLKYEFINIELNGNKLGLYAFEEHFEKSLLENKKLPIGPILRFNEDYSWHELHSTFIEPYQAKFWLTNYPDITQEAISRMEKWRRAELTTSEVFNVESLASFFAITDVLWFNHGQAWKSIRFYYNPETKLINPIGYDGHYNDFFIKNKIAPQLSSTLPIMQVDKKFWVEYYNDWYRLLFSNPLTFDESFFEQYLLYLKEYSDETWIEDFLKAIKNDLDKNLAIISSQEDSYEDKMFSYGEDKFQFSDQSFYSRAAFIKKLLKQEKVIHAYPIHLDNGRMAIEIENIGFIPVKIDSIKIDNGDLKEVIFCDKIILPHQSNIDPKFEIIVVGDLEISKSSNVKVNFHELGDSAVKQIKMFPWRRK